MNHQIAAAAASVLIVVAIYQCIGEKNKFTSTVQTGFAETILSVVYNIARRHLPYDLTAVR